MKRFVWHSTAAKINHPSSLINSDRSLLQRRTNVSLGAMGWKMRLWLWTWTALALFSWSLRSSFEKTAKLQSLEFNLMDLKCVWASLRVCVTLFTTVVRQPSLSRWGYYWFVKPFPHVCYWYVELHVKYMNVRLTSRSVCCDMWRQLESKGLPGSCTGSPAKQHWINILSGEVQTFLIADVLSCHERITIGAL